MSDLRSETNLIKMLTQSLRISTRKSYLLAGSVHRLSQINEGQNRIDCRYNGTTSAINAISSMSVSGMIGGVSATAVLGLGAWLTTRYKVARANEYIVRTGPLIPDIDVGKQAFWLPYQTLSFINIEPITYHFTIEEAMSSEKISFNMPTVFTVGPKDDIDALKIYAKLLQAATPDGVKSKIQNIIHGETRLEAGKMSLGDLFNNREKFKELIVGNINKELSQFGLHVYNANLEELRDMEGTKYFKILRETALESAANKTKVAVAEQTKIGNIGARLHETETRQKIAELEKQAKLAENERDREIAESNAILNVAKAELNKQIKIAESESLAAGQKRELELQKEVEERRNLETLERLRALNVSAANAEAEVAVRKAEGVASALKIEAEAKAIAVKMAAEAQASADIMQANAEAESTKLRAHAHYIEKENEAKGILKLREAEAEGLLQLVKSAGGVSNLSQYLIVSTGVPTKIAEHQAEAVRGMSPKVNVWQTGNQENGGNDLAKTINNIVKGSVPLADGLKQQYGIDIFGNWRKSQSDQS